MKSDLRACFLGDSYVAGQGDATALGWTGRVLRDARAEGADLTLYNLGVRFETGPDIAERAAAEVAPRILLGDRHALVLAFGANDVSQGLPLEASIEAARQVLGWAEGREVAAFLVSPPVMLRELELDARAAAMTEAMAGLGAPFLNLREAVPDWSRWWDEADAGDGSHPNGAGYSLVSGAFHRWRPWRDWLGLP